VCAINWELPVRKRSLIGSSMELAAFTGDGKKKQSGPVNILYCDWQGKRVRRGGGV